MCGHIDVQKSLTCNECGKQKAWWMHKERLEGCPRDPERMSKGFRTLKKSGCRQFDRVLGIEIEQVGRASCKDCIVRWIDDNYTGEHFRHNNPAFEPPDRTHAGRSSEYFLLYERHKFILHELDQRRNEFWRNGLGSGTRGRTASSQSGRYRRRTEADGRTERERSRTNQSRHGAPESSQVRYSIGQDDSSAVSSMFDQGGCAFVIRQDHDRQQWLLPDGENEESDEGGVLSEAKTLTSRTDPSDGAESDARSIDFTMDQSELPLPTWSPYWRPEDH
jgi:hypothetical protein